MPIAPSTDTGASMDRKSYAARAAVRLKRWDADPDPPSPSRVALMRGSGGEETVHVIRCGEAPNVILSDAMPLMSRECARAKRQ